MQVCGKKSDIFLVLTLKTIDNSRTCVRLNVILELVVDLLIFSVDHPNCL
jgi:hypothetical protein